MADEGRGLVRRYPYRGNLDLRLTLSPLQHGRYDCTIRIEPDGAWLGLRTTTGAATLRLANLGGEVEATAWGPAAEEALAAGPGIAGLLDEPDALVPRHPIVRDLQRRFDGLRLPRTGQLMPSLVPAIIEQKVTSTEAHGAYTRLLRRLAPPAPVPDEWLGAAWSLVLPPDPAALAALPYFEYHPMGVERRRAEVLRRVGREAERIEALATGTPEAARAALQGLPGIGPWTAAEVTRAAFGDPDAVSVGDAHIPSMVSWALAREPRADDARMLELLESYSGQRARVIRLLEAAGIMAPRRGPRFAPREIARI